MTCSTCDHTMDRLGKSDMGFGLFWCQRCGTIRSPAFVQDLVPKLVKRCREFGKVLNYPEVAQGAVWGELGIEEAIRLPSDRWPY